jgi:hypothetical protein
MRNRVAAAPTGFAGPPAFRHSARGPAGDPPDQQSGIAAAESALAGAEKIRKL